MNPKSRQIRSFINNLVIITLLLLFTASLVGAESKAGIEKGRVNSLLEKERITIVVTDSGLGGLSVVADAAEKFRQHPVFKQVNLIFYNALFTNQGGYNSLQSREEKLKVFSSALQNIQKRYMPDIILVACNTLSVLVPDTEFIKTTTLPVVGIVENGVEQIAAQLKSDKQARNIIFATRTTIGEGTHKQQLLDKGISDSQIITQACPELTLYIEQGYDSMYTEMLIDAYVDEALLGMKDQTGPLSVSFNCTHYGYSLDLWKKAFMSRSIEVTTFLNPNTRMIDFLLPERLRQRYQDSVVNVKVVSMTDIPADRMESIGRYLQKISPTTEVALRNFEHHLDLFEWRSLVNRD